MCTAFHPETDRETERVTQTTEAILKAFVNLEMRNWVDLLSMAEFTYNNSRNTATGHSPLYANYEFYPNSGIKQPRTDILPVTSKAYGQWLTLIHDHCTETFEKRRKMMKRDADKDRTEAPKYSTGNLVILSVKNIRTRRPCKSWTTNYLVTSK
jgi:hypothetical protein